MLAIPLIIGLLNLTALISAAPLRHDVRAKSKPKGTSQSSKNSTATSNSTTTSGGGASGISVSSLFPIPLKSKWTTLPSAPSALPLSDDTLKPFKDTSALKHNFTSAPDGTPALAAHFPQGAWGFNHQPIGGLSFYAPGPGGDFNWKGAKEVVFGYSIWFEKGFGFNKGGKLPGIYGGSNPTTAVSCSGGRKSTDCFSVRLMFRTDGAGEFYTYLPPSTLDSKFKPNDALCPVKGGKGKRKEKDSDKTKESGGETEKSTKGKGNSTVEDSSNGKNSSTTKSDTNTNTTSSSNSGTSSGSGTNDCNDEYGWSIQRGAFKFTDGAWNTVSMRVLLNDAAGSTPQANGELELWVNGESKIKQGGLVIRGSNDVDFLGIMWQTFFGGSTAAWASPRDQWIYFTAPSAGISQTQ